MTFEVFDETSLPSLSCSTFRPWIFIVVYFQGPWFLDLNFPCPLCRESPESEFHQCKTIVSKVSFNGSIYMQLRASV
jgi:hypothetical protein